MKKVMQNVLAFFALAKLPQKDGSYHLSDEQKAELDAHTEKPGFADLFLQKANEELEAQKELKELQKKQDKLSAEQKKALEELKAISLETGIEMSDEDEEDDEEDGGEGSEPKNDSEATKKELSKLKLQVRELKKQRDTLGAEDDEQAPELLELSGKMINLGHTKTHVFGSTKAFDAIANRPWNQNLIYATTGQRDKVKATDWTDSLNIDQVNRDLADYARLEQDKVVDVMGDYRKLPEFWDVISNVDDEISYTAIINGEITQGRKKNWLAKNRQKFVAIKGKVYPVQIDATWKGYQLQKIETSWMNKYNREGSQAHKMSFVQMLLSKLIEQARKEDNQVLIKGVYFPNEDATEPMSFIHRGKGIVQLADENRGKTYRAFDMSQPDPVNSENPASFAYGKPTIANCVDYVENMVDRLPPDKINMPGLIFYMSPTWARNYFKGLRTRDGLNQDYEPMKQTVENHDNVRIYPLDFMDGEDFMFITTDDNIMILENVPNEKNMIKFDLDKRDINAFGDYKVGIHVETFGAQWTENDPVDFSNQIFWSNNVEVNTTTKIPVDPGVTTPSVKYHNVIQTGANTGATAITNLTDTVEGKYYYIYGNNEGTASTIASGANIQLIGSTLTLDGNKMIKLYKRPGGKLVEILRKDFSTVGFVTLAPDATTADAANGTRFVTSANTQATAFTNIANAVDGVTYRLEGGSDDDSTTIAAANKFAGLSGAMTLGLGDYIDVIYNAESDKFIELTRFVA